jgi:hypothetical protein
LRNSSIVRGFSRNVCRYRILTVGHPSGAGSQEVRRSQAGQPPQHRRGRRARPNGSNSGRRTVHRGGAAGGPIHPQFRRDLAGSDHRCTEPARRPLGSRRTMVCLCRREPAGTSGSHSLTRRALIGGKMER